MTTKSTRKLGCPIIEFSLCIFGAGVEADQLAVPRYAPEGTALARTLVCGFFLPGVVCPIHSTSTHGFGCHIRITPKPSSSFTRPASFFGVSPSITLPPGRDDLRQQDSTGIWDDGNRHPPRSSSCGITRREKYNSFVICYPAVIP